ncbi:MAG TPA: metallophosphoesterase [Pyrinomonadaceae bacterium]
MANIQMSLPPEGVPQFDELYVISDLHLGGPSDFQIFNSGAELAGLINDLRRASPGKKVALLVNGDFVDFLAERPAAHFDPAGAIAKLNRIVEDPSFKPVFKALKQFTNTKNRTLVLMLGNHDLELALPWVRARLLEILTDGKEAGYGRVILAFDGSGFPCRVGGATVLCVHGNEVDAWNVADYERIRRFGVEVSHGRPIDSWVPNAGSQLVIDVMNDLKRKYPFVDLLKPETQGAVPTLLALAPDQHDKLRAIGATVRRLAWDNFKRATGFLGAADDELPGRTAGAADMFTTRPTSSSGSRAEVLDRAEYAHLLLEGASEKYHEGVDPMALLGSDELGGYLGLTSAIFKLVRGEETSEVLREALEGLHKDRSFDPTAEDDTYRLLDESVGAGFDFLIAGHTHLARALERKKGRGWYFNSGTWARLIRLDERVLRDADEFRRVFETFRAGTMRALDDHPNLVTRILSVIVVRAEGKKTLGELRQVSLGPGADVLPAQTDYQFTKAN